MIAFVQHVVIRDGEKVIATALVPVHNLLGVVIPIAPEGMSVQIALPPLGCGRRLSARLRLSARREQTDDQNDVNRETQSKPPLPVQDHISYQLTPQNSKKVDLARRSLHNINRPPSNRFWRVAQNRGLSVLRPFQRL